MAGSVRRTGSGMGWLVSATSPSPTPTAPQLVAPRRASQAVEQLSPLLRGHREPNRKPSGVLAQIGADQKDPIPHSLQPPLKPARGQHGLPKLHQEVTEHTSRPEHRISPVE